MLDAYIYDGLRSPFGRHGGALAAIRPDDLMAQVITALMSRSTLQADMVEDVALGNVCQSGEDSRNLARFSALLAGLPDTVGAQTVNRLCGSSLSAALDVARAVTVGEGDLFVAGGVESMTRAPFVMAKSATAWSRQGEIHDATAGKPFPNPRFQAAFGSDSMPQTADNLAADYGLTRAACDAFAASSQRRFETARKGGFFDGEVIPIEISGRKGAVTTVAEDEHPRPDTTVEKMASLRPLDPAGVVTAANASGINDGAAALLIGRNGLGPVPRGRILAGAVSGVAPRVMGIGPALAIPKALSRAGLSLEQMDVIEINEAFASQVLACCKALDLSPDDSRLNPNGGAIAVGHPLGASGARLMLTGLRQLEASGGRYGCLSMCIGFGQGIAVIIERLK
ncbi:beta-ketoadipyl CoA thiolase [Sulfitobacter sp. HI0082]|jgi:3-oxoadipyl-CoA thiolase|uniref:acetyl-CoA C-acyltransferase n=1 Tax=unclassified Sulfitobacter TaxID=196795 RepID=UPI0007D00E24|nr:MULTISPECIES: acetyl-CoA C-acyltransferase [unclassified Sulfitobacter]KZZ20941.1 beta-ketoadipyl CoA thiolase [Sulfitobacter sp. HI0082]WPZ29737.1 acetyl-CoA C-acyltransferase [Sulfitobacter sp. OXR-159]HAC50894.1 acetyl-CoA C-acyltransferase [Sulfitobacter sp.]|tara:strand:+ start:410 stop:1600 length:1191 start_codon:yes stop_codon:yes gene_type:complete